MQIKNNIQMIKGRFLCMEIVRVDCEIGAAAGRGAAESDSWERGIVLRLDDSMRPL